MHDAALTAWFLCCWTNLPDCLLPPDLQELGPDKFWVSESIFGTLFVMFIFWTFTPFVTQRKRFYTVVMWSRLLMVLVGERAAWVWEQVANPAWG